MKTSRPRTVLFVILLWLIIYVWGIGASDYQYFIESMRAVVAQNMLNNHDWIVPRFGGETYIAKPPLMNWLIALVSLPFGRVTEISGRLISVFSVLILAFLIRGWTRARGWEREADYAACLFLFMPLVFEKGVRAEIEMNLALWVSLSLFWLYRGIEETGNGRRQLSTLLGSYVFLGLGILSKGPAALMFFGGTWLSYQTWRGWRTARWYDHLLGWVVVGSIVAAWVIPLGSRVGWGSIWDTLNRESFERVTVARETNEAPIYFYAVSLLGGAFPCSIFAFWVRRKILPVEQRRAVDFLLCWVLSGTVLFTLVAGKESRYLLPLYPALAILGGIGLRRIIVSFQESGKQRWRSIARIASLAIGLPLAAGFWIGQGIMNVDARLWGVVWSLLLALTVGLLLLGMGRARRWALIVAFFGIVIAIKGFYLTAVVPSANARKSPRTMCEQINSIVAPDEVLEMVAYRKPYIDYYLDCRIDSYSDIDEFLARGGTREKRYLLMRDRELRPEDIGRIEEWYEIRQVSLFMGKTEFVLLLLTKRNADGIS